MVFDAISSNIDHVLSINPSANVFTFGDCNGHHKKLIYSGGTERPGELCSNFLQFFFLQVLNFVTISNNLTQMVNFPS